MEFISVGELFVFCRYEPCFSVGGLRGISGLSELFVRSIRCGLSIVCDCCMALVV